MMKMNFRTALPKNRIIQIAIFSLVGSLLYSVSTPTLAWAAMPSSDLRLDLRANESTSYSTNSGNNWNDLSANNNDATRNGGATWSSTSGTFTFDGTDDYFQISGTPSSLSNFTSGISVSVVANFGNVSFWERLIDLGDGLDIDNNNIIFGRNASTNNLTVIFSDGRDYGSFCTASNAILNNVWATYAFVANGSTCKIYRDGLEIHSQNYRLPTNASRNTNFIGESHISAHNTFEGGMRALAIYGRALSATEVNDARLVQEDPNCISGSDFTETVSGQFTTIKFTNSSRKCIWSGPSDSINAEVAIVGGGGSGGYGNQAGGGGGGEVLYRSSLTLAPNATFEISIGVGGTYAPSGQCPVGNLTNCPGNNGANSSLFINGETITARGGGAGGGGSLPGVVETPKNNGYSGGSSGGSNRFGSAVAATRSTYSGWTSYVNSGGSGAGNKSNNLTPVYGGGGGGGGAGSAGTSTIAPDSTTTPIAGVGGSAIYLIDSCLGGGGSSIARTTAGSNVLGSVPGCSGIATAPNRSGGNTSESGYANTGGGGGAAGLVGEGSGGSGVIVVKYSILPTQTITFASISDKTFNTPSFRAAATTTAVGETVTVTSANTSICTYSGETVTLVSTGTCTLTASQAGSASVAAAPNIVRSFTISKGTPTLGSFSAITKTYGDSTFNLETVTSTVQGSFSFTSLNTSAITISGVSATVVGAGTANIRGLFTPTDTSRWETATVTGSITVNQKDLTVTASSPTLSFGSAIPTITSTYSGFSNGDTSTSISVAPSCTTTYTTSSSPGTSPSTSCSGGTAANYSFVFVSGFVTITKSNRSISFSTTTLSKTYGDDTFTVTAVPSIGAGDGNLSYSKTGSGCSVTSGGTVTVLAVGSCEISATISAGANYDTATTSIPVAVTIGRKALSISGSSIASRVYDGTRTPGTLTVGTLSGLVAGESLTVTGSLSLLNSANADTYTVTATYTLGDGTNGLASNYSLGTESLQAIVTKKALTVTASSPTVSFGSAIPTITPTYSGFAGSENSSNISVAPTCTTTYTTSSNVGSSPSTSCSGGTATNYSFVFVSGVVTITNSSRSISFATTTLSKTYGDSTFSVTATPSLGIGDGTITYSKSGSGCSVTTAGTVTVLAVSSCEISAMISAGINYETATTSIPVAVTIGRKALSISGSRIASKIYDGTRIAGSLTVGTLSGLVAGESLTVTGALSLLNSANADTYTATATYTLGDGPNGLAANYSLDTESLQAVVTKKALTVTASSPTVAYGDGKPAITFEYSGFAGSDNSTSISQAPTCDTVYTTTSNYGSSPASSCSGAAATNYTFTYVSGTVTITRVNLTVTASSHTLDYGDAVPTFTYTITGFKNSQNSSVLSTLPTCITTDYSNTSPRGTYYSRCSGATATNYTFTYVDGVITVNIVTRSVSLSVGTTTLTYGDSTTATFSMTGNQSDGSLALSVFSGSCQITGGRILATSGIDSCVIRATASGATSYSDTFTALTITLAKKALSVSGTTIASRVYNGANTRGAITVGTVTGYVGSDNLTVNAAALDYSGSSVGTYSVTVQYTLVSTAQGTSSNYSLASQSISGQITAKPLTVTAPSLSRHFSQALPASLNPTITGFVNSETASVLSTIPTCTTTYTTSSTVGSSQSTSCSGGVATNYTFTYVSGVVTVTTLVRTLEVSSDKSSLVYGESAALTFSVSIGANDGALSATITGNGCVFGFDSSTVIAIDPNGTCTINSSITGGLNYNDAEATPITISLIKKSLTISGLSTSAKTYDGTLIAPVSGGTLVGLINSDSVTVTSAARFADKSVGRNKPVTAISSISGAAASKYTLVQPTLPSETITAATVTVAGLSVRSRPANGTRAAVVSGTPVLTGVVVGDSVTLVNFSQGLFETSTVGDSLTVTISMSLSGSDSNNYILSIPTYRADITIAYDNTITFAPIANLSIGSSPFVLAASTTSGLQITFISSGSACSLNGETVTILALGSCSITASQAGTLTIGGTVPAATPITRIFTVTTRAITITADDKTYIVGGRATPTYKISGGLISGDRINSVAIRYSGGGLNNSATAPKTSGNYSINVSNAVFSNSTRASLYTVTYVPGTLVIFDTTPKELSNLKVLRSAGSANDLLQGAFSNSTNSYSLRVDYAVSSVLVTMARPNSTNVSVQVRVNESGWRTLRWSNIVGGTTDSGVLPLPAATNTIALRLYGSDKELDSQTRTISILIYRDQASRPVPSPADTSTAIATFTDRTSESTIPAAAAISAITFTPEINFGLFNPNTDSYTANVAKRVSAISITTNFTGNGITVKISVNNGPQKAIPASGKSETYALAIGSNTVAVRATSPDGSIQQYLFTIRRAST